MKHNILITTAVTLALTSQFVCAGSISDTYATGDTLTATKMDNIKSAVNGNADDISTNTTNIGINDNNITSNTTRIDTLETTNNSGGIVGNQIPDFNSGVTLDNTINKSLLTVTIPNSGSVDVALDAHLYIEKGNASTGRYEFSIRATSCSGTLVGMAMWRPDAQTNGFVATTISLTGFHSITTSTTYHLCGRKFDASAVDASVLMRGLNAIFN